MIIYLEKDEIVDLTKSKEERFKFGDRAEEFVYKDLIAKGYKVKSTKSFNDWSTAFDSKKGDLLFYEKNLFVDVKLGRRLSQKSIDNFEGYGYLFVTGIGLGKPVNTKKTYFVSARTIQSLASKSFYINQKPIPEEEAKNSNKLITKCYLPSGDIGAYINFDLLTAKKNYNDFLNIMK